MSGMDAAGQVLRLERLIPASCESLFALWIEPEQIVRWWAPDGYEAEVRDLEVRPGGRWRIVLRNSAGKEAAVSGLFRVVEPPQRLAFSWAWEEAHGTHGRRTEVSVNFERVPGGTRLVLIQQGFDGENARDRHLAGWSASIERMINLRKDEHPS
jgi:uncharacterized protein YndB with AHSA1/START domain